MSLSIPSSPWRLCTQQHAISSGMAVELLKTLANNQTYMLHPLLNWQPSGQHEAWYAGQHDHCSGQVSLVVPTAYCNSNALDNGISRLEVPVAASPSCKLCSTSNCGLHSGQCPCAICTPVRVGIQNVSTPFDANLMHIPQQHHHCCMQTQ